MSPIGFPSLENLTDTVVINQAGDPALLPSESLQILPSLRPWAQSSVNEAFFDLSTQQGTAPSAPHSNLSLPPLPSLPLTLLCFSL